MKNLLLLLFCPIILVAQSPSLEAFKKYPFPTELCTAQDSKIAFALDEQGLRNVYVAEAPNYTPRKLTNYTQDDGQEITSLQISADGKFVVYVLGGEHGSNWDENLPTNPSGDLQPNTVKIFSIPFNGGESLSISEGDYPLISPDSKTVAFIKGNQLWISAIDSTKTSKNLFTTRGTVSQHAWSPDGNSLLFVSDRGDHDIIGVYAKNSKTIKWIAPSFALDSSPRWSPDGSKIVFVRQPGNGGSPAPLLTQTHKTWGIWVADLQTGIGTEIWKTPATVKGNYPNTHGQTNLHWAAGNRIVFMSYKDGWPHLYSINATGGSEILLTPGNFMCEHISLSPDKKCLTFSANTGPDKLDIERRHAAKVSVDKADMQVLTPGNGIEFMPILIENNSKAVLISATVQRPPMPAIFNLENKKLDLLTQQLLPADFPESKFITPKQVIFTASDGVQVHADLFEPTGGPSKKPTLVYIHGGPPRQMLLGWHYGDYYANAYAVNQYLASQGFVVLAVNYRLGIGYGHVFHNIPNGGVNGAAEYADIRAAGQWLQKQSFVDINKIGIFGGSYGGYLTAMGLAKDSKMFSAGVDIHGVHDMGVARGITTMFTGKSEKAPDYEKAIQTAWLSSPVSAMATWKSPVMIIHADDDRNVRFNQSTDLINRLEQYKIPYKSLIIVDDTHHWLKWTNAVKVYQTTADYFLEKYK
jgi:dipeptidyl aminopeptidase/acylaminoacyl peptidase